LNYGKFSIQEFVKKHGGKMTTGEDFNYLVVPPQVQRREEKKEVGARKYEKALGCGAKCIDIYGLKIMAEGGQPEFLFENQEPQTFSAGFRKR
jgi:hypothetical protein